MTKKLFEYARIIRNDWDNESPHATPYIDAMVTLDDIFDMYYDDTAFSVVSYFLSNAKTWRGPVARQIKKELNAMLKMPRNA